MGKEPSKEATESAFRFIARIAEGDLAKALIAAQKRIAELEAELATWKERCGQAEVALKHTETDAEKAEARWDSCKRMLEDRNAQLDKAEAEVERLRADCRAHTRNHRVPGHTHPEPCCLADYPGFHCETE